MKKIFTLRNIVLFCGALLLLVAFFLSFAAGLKMIDHGSVATYNNIIWGSNSITIDGEKITMKDFMGIDKVQPALLPLIGLILILAGALAAVLVGLLVKKPWAKWVVIVCAVIALTGAVFQFFAYTAFIRAFVMTMFKEAHYEPSAEEIKEAMDTMKENTDKLNPTVTVSIIMGILGAVGGLAVGASQLLPEKK